MNKKNFKAQIGIFVIISIIIVILGVVLFSMNSDTYKIFSDQKSSYKVNEFVKSCMIQVGNKGINEIGLHGGWLYTPPNMLFTEKDKPIQYNRIANGIDYMGLKIPYWYYYDDSNKQFKFQIPPYASDDKYSLQSQLDRYIKENLMKNCLNDFKSFKDVYDIKYNINDLNLKVDFDKKDVVVSLNFPLQINDINKNRSEFVKDFEVNLDNKLYVPYNLARDIVDSEKNDSFIEEKILSMIIPYQTSSNRKYLPPFYDYKIGYDFKPWKIESVKKLYKNIVSSNIGLIQFANTDYKVNKMFNKYKGSEFAQGISKVFLKNYLYDSKTKKDNPAIFEEFRNYEVTPKYEVFMPTFFSIAPSAGDVILLPKPEAFISFLPFFFTEYVAVYEVTMPIEFELKNSQNKNDKFVFNFFIESNIDHNTPLAKNRDYSLNQDKVKLQDNNDLMICDPTQRISELVRINISDPVKKGFDKRGKLQEVGINDAIVTFDCKGIDTCYVEQTSENAKYNGNGLSELEFRLPINCNPGTLEISKFGSKKLVFKNLDPNLNQEIDLGSYYMESEKQFNLRFKLISPEDTRFANGKSVKKGETGFVIFENNEDKDYVRVVDFKEADQYNQTLNLIPGNYTVTGYVLTENPFTIPEERICYSKGLFSGDDCQTIPEIKMDSWVKGGIKLNNFEVTLKNVLNNDKLVIPMINFGIPHNFEELGDSNNIMADLEKNSIGKEPYFQKK